MAYKKEHYRVSHVIISRTKFHANKINGSLVVMIDSGAPLQRTWKYWTNSWTITSIWDRRSLPLNSSVMTTSDVPTRILHLTKCGNYCSRQMLGEQSSVAAVTYLSWCLVIPLCLRRCPAWRIFGHINPAPLLWDVIKMINALTEGRMLLRNAWKTGFKSAATRELPLWFESRYWMFREFAK